MFSGFKVYGLRFSVQGSGFRRVLGFVGWENSDLVKQIPHDFSEPLQEGLPGPPWLQNLGPKPAELVKGLWFRDSEFSTLRALSPLLARDQ